MLKKDLYKFFCLFYISVIFQTYGQQINRLDTKEGLVYGTVNVFEKDSLGFMWIGTSQGLNRFSGSGFKQYKLGTGYQFQGQQVIDIINHRGRLFLITNNGSLFKYHYKKDNFKLLLSQEDKKFLSLAQLNDDHLLIGMSSGLSVFDINTNKISEPQYQTLNLIRSLGVYDDTVYSATPKGLVAFSFNIDTKKLIKKQTYLEGRDIIDFKIDESGNIWVGTEVDGLFKISNDEVKKINLNLGFQKSYAIRKIDFDRKQNILVAIDRLGLFVLNNENRIINRYSHEPDNDNSISQNSIYDIYVDDYNAIWLGLREGGVNIIYENDNPFTNIRHQKNLKNSIYNNNIRSIYQDKNDVLWLGTENGVSKFYDGQWTNYNENTNVFNTAILAIEEYQDEILLGTYGEGLLRIDRQDGTISTVNLDTEKPLKFIFNLHVFDNNLWISSSDNSLMYFNRDKLIHHFKIGFVRDIEEGFDDIIYAISDTGLYQINKRNNSSRKIISEVFNTVNIGYSLKMDPLNSCLWIGSKNGLYKYNLANEKLELINDKFNEDLGPVYTVQKDNMQNLYLGTISGLWNYNIKKGIFRKFDKQDGLRIEYFGVGGSAEINNGKLAFGGSQGAVIFNPSDLASDQHIEDVFISKFQINGKSPDTSHVKNNINYAEKITLKSSLNSLAFRFEALKYHGSQRNLFEWQLVGKDDSLQSAYGQQDIQYSNLEPGNYTLKFTAYNANGIKAEDNSIDFKLLKPFWRTYWAYAAYILLFLFIGLLIYKFSQVQSEKKFNENRIRFFVDVAHDIRTPVSLIQLLVKQLANQQNVEKSMELIHRNTQNLNEYVTQLLDFQKIYRKQLELNVSQVDLKDFLLKIIEDFKPLIDEKSLKLNLKVKHIPVWFDAPKMKRIFYNMISNAIKYSNEGGQIDIQAFMEDKKLKIDFIDNGIGIPEKQQEAIFKRFTRGTNVTNKGVPGTGIGLMLSKKIVELHGGKIRLKSKENKGSKFTIILPNDTEHYEDEHLVNTPQAEESINDVNELINEGKQILLVEDNDELSQAIAKELSENYKILEARNGKEGLLKALSENPDLIITDVMMPKMDGKEMCKLLKTNLKTSHIPIIMLTALADVDDKIKGLETGADAYLEKPLNLPILQATIINLLKSRENIKNILEDTKTDKKLTPDESFLSDVISVIKDNIKEQDFSIDMLCDIMGLSRSNLFRKLKKLIQMSPSNLIIKIKLNHAQELMKTNKNGRISDIAYESGFNDPKYFSTLFKKHYNKTPKEFMEEC